MGTAIQLAGDRRDNFPDFLDFDYSELVYMITRINDPSCVGIVEVVASKVDARRNITVAQYGYAIGRLLRPHHSYALSPY